MAHRTQLKRALAVALLLAIVVTAFSALSSSGFWGPATKNSEDSLVATPLPDLPADPDAAPAMPVPPSGVTDVDLGPDGVDRRVLVTVTSETDPASLVDPGAPAAGGEVLEVLAAVGNIVVVRLPDDAEPAAAVAAAFEGFPGVVTAMADEVVTVSSAGSQSGVQSWALDRIDQPTLPLDAMYNYRHLGSGVRVYVVDTGVRSTHTEFTGRIAAGYSIINDGRGTDEALCLDVEGNRDVGHGTGVTSAIAGTTFGVAKNATIVPIRVFNCLGAGTWAGIAAGLDWVITNHPIGTPGVVNMSLGGSGNTTGDNATRAAINAGLSVAVPAGNENGSACDVSPGRVAEAITVGATAIDDTRASFSNFGPCVDVFAPGSSVPVAGGASDVAAIVTGGTSMSAPYVAGFAALLLAENSALTPAQVQSTVVGTATTGVVTNPGAGSPNRLLFASPNVVADADAAASGQHIVSNTTHSFHATPGTPAVIYKRQISDNTQIAALALGTGENTVGSAVISYDGTTGYFALNTTPMKVVKVNLAGMTRTGEVTLDASENYTHAAVISADSTRGYFATGDSPAKLVTVDLVNMVRLGATALTYADGVPRSAARVNSAAVFGTNTSPGNVIRATLTGTQATRDSVLVLNAGENDLRSAVTVPNSSIVLFGTNTAPGRVVQVNVGGSSVLRASALTLTEGNNNLIAASVAPNGVYAYFTTNTSPGRVIKVPTGIT